jgi:ribosomal protein S18 acetylase RimI-like enzyme
VHPHAEGLGIGRRLVDYALEEARRRGKTAAILYCIDRNERARGVYSRAGFRVVHREKLWWLRWLLGFSSSYLMRARVAAASETAG